LWQNNLWSDANLLATGTNDGFVPSLCEPIAGILFNKSLGCQGIEVTYTDFSYNASIDSRQWTFQGGTPAESTDSIVTVRYENGGVFDVTLQVSNSQGSDELVNSQLLTITDTLLGYSNPVTEGFDNASFPVNSTDESLSWSVFDEGDGNWEYTSEAAYSGDGSLRIKNYLNGDGKSNIMISPNIDLSNFEPAFLNFRMAYSKKHEGDVDELRVYFSKDCGQSWSLRYYKTGSSLSNNVQTGTYIPTQNDWRLETINLSTIEGWEHLMVKFEMVSYGGNCLYIDELSIDEASLISEYKNYMFSEFEVYPNPISQNTILSYNLTEKNAVNLSIQNLLGQVVFSDAELLNAGNHEIQLDKLARLNSGVYFIKLSTKGYSKTIKIIAP